MAAYTKDSLAEYIAGTENIPKTSAKRIIGDILDYITAGVAEGEEVVIHGFGKFYAKKRPTRTGRNPATGETIQIPAKTTLAFKPAKQANDKVNA